MKVSVQNGITFFLHIQMACMRVQVRVCVCVCARACVFMLYALNFDNVFVKNVEALRASAG